MAGSGPQLAVSGKDAVAQKLPPFFVEALAFPVIGKLASEDSLDILWVDGEDGTESGVSVYLYSR